VNELRWLVPLVFLIASSYPSGQASKAQPERPVPFADVTAVSRVDFVHKSGGVPP